MPEPERWVGPDPEDGVPSTPKPNDVDELCEVLPQQPDWKASILVQETLAHQINGSGETFAVGEPYRFPCVSDEQPCHRINLRAGPDWAPLNAGWLDPKHVGMLWLRNDEGKFDRRPGPAELAALARKVLEVALVFPEGKRRTMYDAPASRPVKLNDLKPGRTMRLPDPADVAAIVVRCPAGEIRFSAAFLPR